MRGPEVYCSRRSVGAACTWAGPAGTWEGAAPSVTAFACAACWMAPRGGQAGAFSPCNKWASGTAESPVPPFEGALAQPSPLLHADSKGGRAPCRGAWGGAGRVLHSPRARSRERRICHAGFGQDWSLKRTRAELAGPSNPQTTPARTAEPLDGDGLGWWLWGHGRGMSQSME